jgi:hypothetical protein
LVSGCFNAPLIASMIRGGGFDAVARWVGVHAPALCQSSMKSEAGDGGDGKKPAVDIISRPAGSLGMVLKQ